MQHSHRWFHIGFLIASFALLEACRNTTAAPVPAPPPQVSVITLMPERVGLTSEWIATLDGYVNAQIRPQVSGYLIRRAYEEGAVCTRADPFKIDPQTFGSPRAGQAAAEAEAQVGKTGAIFSATGRSPNNVRSPGGSWTAPTKANLAAQATVRSAAAA